MPPPPVSFATRWLHRRSAAILWWITLFTLAGVAAYPVGGSSSRVAEVIFAGAWLVESIGLAWRHRWLRWTLLALCALAALFVTMPGRQRFDRMELRQQTVLALKHYAGVRYFRGGENRLGMDGAGLVRRGAIDALFRCGLQQGNPVLVRRAAVLWWQGGGVRELLGGAGGKAQRLYEVKTMAGMDDSRLHPGDFAMAQNGTWAGCFLGNHLWIHAGADTVNVTLANLCAAGVSPVQGPVMLLRWRHLELEQLVGRRRGMQ